MKASLLEILYCPACKGDLRLTVFEEKQCRAKEVMEGMLACSKCGKSHAVIAGIPRFVPNMESAYPDFFKKYAKQFPGSAEKADFARIHGDTQERFGYEWMNYPGAMDEDKDVFLYETQIPEGGWKGKRIMDAGCGMGRYSRVAHSLGAEVVALDLSGALVRLWDVAESSERMHMIQGNLLELPIRPDVFDTVYSVGVIHHTPSAPQAFDNLSKLVKRGGQLAVWVYGAPGKYENFKTNPLREGRKGLATVRFPVWAVNVVREFLSDALRIFTVHMPHKLLYGICYPLALLGKVPLIKYLTFSVHPLWRVRLQENFDWLTPPYQSHHTKEEVVGWFEKNGFEVLSILPHGFVPKPGALGKKK